MEHFDQGFLDYLKTYLSESRKSVIEEVLAQRTRHFTVVLEDISKPHNASAVLRTADCFGLQDVHVIEHANEYKVNPYVTRGASHWIDLHKYSSKDSSPVLDCFGKLRANGYKIYGTSPALGSMTIHELDPLVKTALVFGNEHDGISQDVKDQADGLVHIPMMGFTESFNISVSASIFLYELTKKVKDAQIENYHLSESEKNVLRMKWYQLVIRRVDLYEKAYLKNQIL
jgi:tRNA (guanosine-2'-O-)-methyltransferase